MAISAEAASFSSSMNSTIPPWKYHVFLSFRGEDTRKRFTDHLHAALQQKGIITFLDDELRRGEEVYKKLLQAIEESLSSIVILSENYASSTWCLDELQKILESRESLGREVFPVFYNIDPSDVRHQRRTFADAFQKHSERFSEEKVQRWRNALKEVANISGYDSMDWHETKLIKEIVTDVWTKLEPKLPSCENELVGIEPKIEEVNSILRMGLSDVHLLGIWGMGGIGKTSLARIVYERTCNQFDFYCFLADVREVFEKKGLPYLQRKFLLHLKFGNMEFDDAYEGKQKIRSLLCNKKVLVALDDVSEMNQLEYLAIKQAWLGPGSRVIVTTRNKHLLTTHGEFEEYEAKLLDNEESLQLFYQRAFTRDKPGEDYLEFSKSVVEFAAGLPLTLKVLGCHLCGRNILEWKDALEKIKKLPPDDILKRLRISYEALDYMEQNIFLDIACCFKLMAKDQVTQILEKCGFHPTIGIRELVEKCLVIEYRDCIPWHLGMHDILQEMGKSIVLEKSLGDVSKQSRLWSKEDINHVLTKNKGSEFVQVIHLQSPMQYEPCWVPEAFSMMCNLRILIISCDVCLPHGLKYLPSSLKILEWKRYPLKSLPLGVHLYELVDLKMHYSKIVQLWNETQMSEKIKFIDLSHSKDLIQTPDFSMLPNLEQLVLEGCIKLVKVHPSLGHHKKIVLVNLKDCKNLTVFPSKLKMDSLRKLILSGCSKVEKLPEFGENMRYLSMLDLKDCKILVCLPSSIGNLKSLKTLDINGCSKLLSLPNNLGENECLEELDVSGTAIREIPSSIIGLQNLRMLYTNGCRGSAFGLLWNVLSPILRVLGFNRYETPMKLVLPPFVSNLSSLKELQLSNCNLSATSIPNDLNCLSSLEVLDLSLNNFGNLPAGSWVLPASFSSLSSLKSLRLSFCNLHDGSIPDDLSSLSSLNTLDLSGNNFTSLPSSFVSNLLLLKYLYLHDCKRLLSLPNVPPNVRNIYASFCYLMKPLSFPELPWNFIAGSDFQVSLPEDHIFSYIGQECVEIQIPGSEIPSWFQNHNFDFLDEVYISPYSVVQTRQFFMNNDHMVVTRADCIVSINVDVSRFCGSSGRWGISLCLLLQNVAPTIGDLGYIRLSFIVKTNSQESYLPRPASAILLNDNNPHLFIMFLACNYVRDDCNQVEFIFWTHKDFFWRAEGKIKAKSESLVLVRKCGWRVTSKEDIEEWRRTMSASSSRCQEELGEDVAAFDVQTEPYA